MMENDVLDHTRGKRIYNHLIYNDNGIMSLNVKQCDVTPIIVQYAKNIKEFMTTEEEMSKSTNDKNGGTIANTNEDGPNQDYQVLLKN